MRIRTGLISYFMACCLFLSGCGDGFVDLTEDESKQIVNYSTNVLNDHNSAVKGSLENLSKTDLRDIVIKDDPSIIDDIEAAKAEATAEAEEAAAPEPAKDNNDGGGSSDAPDSEDTEHAPLEVQDADIASILGLSGFSVEYAGHDITESYPGDSESGNEMTFSIEPATQNDKLLILNFDITNTGDSEAVCDILSLQPRFRFSTGGRVHSFLTTLLLNDLSTLSVSLAPGESKRAVLAAEISNEKADALSDLTLIIIGGEENTEIVLEK